MDFGLTQEQSAIRDTARKFSRSRLLPEYRQRESDGRVD